MNMSFSKEWEDCYEGNRHLNKWPWSDMIGAVYRHSNLREGDSVLELGFGSGPNIRFFESIGVHYFGIEGSRSAVAFAKDRYPFSADKLLVGDFTESIPFAMKFDLILDRGSVSHNSTKAILKTADLIYDSLKDDGVFLAIDWFSTASDLYSDSTMQGGFLDGDRNTVVNMNGGCAANLGRVHFSDRSHLEKIFKRFEFRVLEHRITMRNIPQPEGKDAYWDFVLTKI
jgi:hypothetical protein